MLFLMDFVMGEVKFYEAVLPALSREKAGWLTYLSI